MPHRVSPQTLRRLTYFAAIAEAGSIREAARRLGLSVASVSEALAALEDELGTTLAVRNTRRLQLTEEGRRVEHIAVQVLDAGAALFAGAQDPAQITGYVALTAPVEIAQSWLPAYLERFAAKHPRVSVTVSASDHLVDLSQSKFDLAIRALYLPPGSARRGVLQLPLTCASATPLPLEPCAEGWQTPVTLLAHHGGNHLDVTDRLTGKAQVIRFADVMMVDNKHVALAMVARGMGAALVTQIALEGAPDLCACPPEFEFGHVGLDIEMRDKRPSPAALALQTALLPHRMTASQPMDERKS